MVCPVSRAAAQHADQVGLSDEIDAARASFIARRASELRQAAVSRGHMKFEGDLRDVGEILGPLEHQSDMMVFNAIYAALNGNTAAIVAVLNDELQRCCENEAEKEWLLECHEINHRTYKIN